MSVNQFGAIVRRRGGRGGIETSADGKSREAGSEAGIVVGEAILEKLSRVVEEAQDVTSRQANRWSRGVAPDSVSNKA